MWMKLGSTIKCMHVIGLRWSRALEVSNTNGEGL